MNFLTNGSSKGITLDDKPADFMLSPNTSGLFSESVSPPDMISDINISQFIPVTIDWQLSECKTLGLVPYRDSLGQFTSRCSNTLTNITKIVGDGNCFFRAVSFVVAGTQLHHLLTRAALVSHMRRYCYFNIFHNTPDEFLRYISDQKLDRHGTWATDIEIHYMAHLLRTNIYVHKTEYINGWHCFTGTHIEPGLNISPCSIFLVNTNNNHYDVAGTIHTHAPATIDIFQTAASTSITLASNLSHSSIKKQSPQLENSRYMDITSSETETGIKRKSLTTNNIKLSRGAIWCLFF